MYMYMYILRTTPTHHGPSAYLKVQSAQHLSRVAIVFEKAEFEVVKEMGGFVGKQMSSVMEENLKKNQEFMLKTQKMQVRLFPSVCV